MMLIAPLHTRTEHTAALSQLADAERRLEASESSTVDAWRDAYRELYLEVPMRADVVALRSALAQAEARAQEEAQGRAVAEAKWRAVSTQLAETEALHADVRWQSLQCGTPTGRPHGTLWL